MTVALKDWGRIVQRPIFEIYILEDRFRELEWQAISYALAHIKSIGNRTRWPHKAIKLTRLLLERQEGWIKIIKSVQKEAAVDLQLRPESEDVMKPTRIAHPHEMCSKC